MSFILSSIGVSKDSIPYRKELRDLCGSIPATILFVQLLYWFDKWDYEEFYKFISPSLGNSKYRIGDSWIEELGFSYDEFALAFSKIGYRCKSKKDYIEGGIPDSTMFYSYTDKIHGVTYWGINIDITVKNVEVCYANQKSIKNKKNIVLVDKQSKLANPNYGDGQSLTTQTGKPQVDIYTETTTETTTETNQQFSSENFSQATKENIPFQPLDVKSTKPVNTPNAKLNNKQVLENKINTWNNYQPSYNELNEIAINRINYGVYKGKKVFFNQNQLTCLLDCCRDWWIDKFQTEINEATEKKLNTLTKNSTINPKSAFGNWVNKLDKVKPSQNQPTPTNTPEIYSITDLF